MDEEAMIIEQVLAARHRLRINQEDMQELKFERIKYEKELAEVEQALLDYLIGNGLVKTERVTLGESEAIEVENIDAVPEGYIRIKKEVNKSLIQKERPTGNWYTIRKNPKLTIKK